MSITSLLVLVDGRFPDGAHAHSHGLEAAVGADRVIDSATLESYVRCRLWTTGRTDAAAARLAAGGWDPEEVDRAWCIRTPSAAARNTGRTLGRALSRPAARLTPGLQLTLRDGTAVAQPVAVGMLATALGCTPGEAAMAVAYGLAATLSAAGLRLLLLDPFDVAAVVHALRPDIDDVVAATEACTDPCQIPHVSTPLAEIDVESQVLLPTRLFRS